jgi:lysozyme
MRGIFLVMAAAILASCGSSSPPQATRQVQPAVASRAAAVPPRFADSDPWDWGHVAPWHYPVHGVDVSKYQGSIDWARVRGSGAAFAFIKATEGGDVLDERFLANWTGAAGAGLLRGAYHYYYFCRSPQEQARWFAGHVPVDMTALPPVLDMEWTHRSRTCPLRPSPEAVRAVMHTYLTLVGQHYGKRPVIYTTVDFYRDNELWKVEGYHFWLRSVADHPANTYPEQDWAFWQYTGTGMVPGIPGDTDINVFAGSPDQWRLWAAGMDARPG